MPTILVLNGDALIAELVSGVLKEAGFDTFHTTDSYEALSLLVKSHVDLLIQNIARRDIDGFQFYRLMKSEEQLRDIPMIIFTGFPAVVSSVEEEGVSDDRLHKVKFLMDDPPKSLYVEGCVLLPVDPKKLPEVIKPILQKCSRSPLTEQQRAMRNRHLWSKPSW